MKLRLALFAALLAILSSCASRAERESLRRCAFAPKGLEKLPGTADSLSVALVVEIRNPGPEAAVVDSLAGEISFRNPIARISHGALRRIAAGATDTVQIQVSLAKANLLPLALSLAMSPPDSLAVSGSVWVPGVLFGYNEHKIQQRIPAKALIGAFRGLVSP